MNRLEPPTKTTKLPTATEISANGGLKALLIDVPDCPAIRFELSFRAGEVFCPPDKPELAHFLEHLVAMSNQRYPSTKEFDRVVTRHGGRFGAWTAHLDLWYEFDAPDSDWERMLGLMLLAASQPLFSPDEFKSEKEVVRQELEEYRDQRWRVLEADADRATGFVAPSLADRIDRLAGTSLAAAKDYYQKTHTAGNCRLLVAGRLPPDRRQRIGQRLDELVLPAGPPERFVPPAERLSGAGIVYLPDKSAETVYLDLQFVNGRPCDSLAESDNLEVLWSLLAVGFDSRIFGQARDRGLIYFIDGGFGSTPTSSHFYFECQVGLDNLEPLVDLIQAEIDRLLAGDLTEGEVDRIKARLAGGFQLDHLTPVDWVLYFRRRYLDFGQICPVDYPARLAAIGRKSILKLAGEIFGPADWTLGLMGQVPSPVRDRLAARLARNKTTKSAQKEE